MQTRKQFYESPEAFISTSVPGILCDSLTNDSLENLSVREDEEW